MASRHRCQAATQPVLQLVPPADASCECSHDVQLWESAERGRWEREREGERQFQARATAVKTCSTLSLHSSIS